MGSVIMGNLDGDLERVAFNVDDVMAVLGEQVEVLKGIGSLSMNMMEPLSFQDLVGQRIQKIIKLVKTMESRIEDLIISFGIKFKRHKEDPGKSYEELSRDVELYKSELRGTQREGG